jgi:tetratricopeptide (TPR) repeat protein
VAPEARAKLGRLLREQKAYAAARDALEKALVEMGLGASGPSVALTLTELGRLEEEAPGGDYQKAYERYRRALEADPASAPAYYFIGKMLSGQKGPEQKQKGKEALENYLRLAPHGEFAAEARTLIG